MLDLPDQFFMHHLLYRQSLTEAKFQMHLFGMDGWMGWHIACSEIGINDLEFTNYLLPFGYFPLTKKIQHSLFETKTIRISIMTIFAKIKKNGNNTILFVKYL